MVGALQAGTGTEDEREAVKVANKRMLYAEVGRECGIQPGGRTFAFIAEHWLKRKRVEVEKGLSTKIKVDACEAIVRHFHLPYARLQGSFYSGYSTDIQHKRKRPSHP